ncbi:transglycosylase family protein [Jatrophihabitans lederbergiae]|uniref:Transglycosylase family protein n=1 Tax=Jatrophihabitans lederbergiae TaxID=3075547 RepID=A0ABU2JID4_9ACTN|nr:transglycosylase family protein [Jatrophihabitans sp. DSM 44399]MDT0264516.1 transglycosylase family protein [Jatrophihabitans sp. DSM 44399]
MFTHSYLGRHRAAPTSLSARVTHGTAVTAVTATVALASLGVFTGPAAASPTHNWDGVARCESSGNWHINTGNGFYGGLQFTAATWLGYGGGAYAPRADLAGQGAQITIAERVLAGQGIGAWPVCGQYLGAASAIADTQPNTQPTTPTHITSPAPAPALAEHTVDQDADGDGDGDDSGTRPGTGQSQYVVRSGDTLNRIALQHHITGGWATLAHLNHNVINNPDLIYPGQHITL